MKELTSNEIKIVNETIDLLNLQKNKHLTFKNETTIIYDFLKICQNLDEYQLSKDNSKIYFIIKRLCFFIEEFIPNSNNKLPIYEFILSNQNNNLTKMIEQDENFKLELLERLLEKELLSYIKYDKKTQTSSIYSEQFKKFNNLIQQFDYSFLSTSNFVLKYDKSHPIYTFTNTIKNSFNTTLSEQEFNKRFKYNNDIVFIFNKLFELSKQNQNFLMESIIKQQNDFLDDTTFLTLPFHKIKSLSHIQKLGIDTFNIDCLFDKENFDKFCFLFDDRNYKDVTKFMEFSKKNQLMLSSIKNRMNKQKINENSINIKLFIRNLKFILNEFELGKFPFDMSYSKVIVQQLSNFILFFEKYYQKEDLVHQKKIDKQKLKNKKILDTQRLQMLKETIKSFKEKSNDNNLII